MILNSILTRIHVATILILVLAIVGAILVIMGNLGWDQYFKDITTGGGLLAIGRGISSIKVNK